MKRCDYIKHCCRPIRYRVAAMGRTRRYCAYHYRQTGLGRETIAWPCPKVYR